jgi:hypothetical protein
MFFGGIRSERHLIATASFSLAHHWYLGYALDEDLPTLSILARTGSDSESPSSNAFLSRSSTYARRRGSSGQGVLVRCH